MGLDCIIVSKLSTHSEEKWADYDVFRHPTKELAFSYVKKYNFNFFRIISDLIKVRIAQRYDSNVRKMLVGKEKQQWGISHLINYVRDDSNLKTSDQSTLNGAYLYTYLNNKGFTCKLYKTLEFDSIDDFKELLKDKPKSVVISSTFIRIDQILVLKEIYFNIKKISPETQVILGGKSMHWSLDSYPEFKTLV